MSSMIRSDPSILMGKPVIAGTRLTVELILEKLGAGETIEQLLESHPRLTREAVLEAVGAEEVCPRLGEGKRIHPQHPLPTGNCTA